MASNNECPIKFTYEGIESNGSLWKWMYGRAHEHAIKTASLKSEAQQLTIAFKQYTKRSLDLLRYALVMAYLGHLTHTLQSVRESVRKIQEDCDSYRWQVPEEERVKLMDNVHQVLMVLNGRINRNMFDRTCQLLNKLIPGMQETVPLTINYTNMKGQKLATVFDIQTPVFIHSFSRLKPIKTIITMHSAMSAEELAMVKEFGLFDFTKYEITVEQPVCLKAIQLFVQFMIDGSLPMTGCNIAPFLQMPTIGECLGLKYFTEAMYMLLDTSLLQPGDWIHMSDRFKEVICNWYLLTIFFYNNLSVITPKQLSFYDFNWSAPIKNRFKKLALFVNQNNVIASYIFTNYHKKLDSILPKPTKTTKRIIFALRNAPTLDAFYQIVEEQNASELAKNEFQNLLLKNKTYQQLKNQVASLTANGRNSEYYNEASSVSSQLTCIRSNMKLIEEDTCKMIQRKKAQQSKTN